VVPLQPPGTERELGFMVGQGTITADVKAAFADDIDKMFGTGN
jgi:hypothetical protein